MLTLSETVVLLPRWSRGVLPFWRRFVAAWDDLYDVGMQPEERPQGGGGHAAGGSNASQENSCLCVGSPDPHRPEDR